jgi:rRNA processing protein Krr1/Pno1
LQQKCYIVATCDRELKRRIRKQPGVPILYIKQHQFTVERMPDAYGGMYFSSLVSAVAIGAQLTGALLFDSTQYLINVFSYKKKKTSKQSTYLSI